jgi:hypothetical protein
MNSRSDIDENTAKRRKLNRSNVEEYLNINLIFTKELRNHEEFYLDTGEYIYPFQIQIPKQAPTSFEHSFGRICYSLNGTIDIPKLIL